VCVSVCVVCVCTYIHIYAAFLTYEHVSPHDALFFIYLSQIMGPLHVSRMGPPVCVPYMCPVYGTHIRTGEPPRRFRGHDGLQHDSEGLCAQVYTCIPGSRFATEEIPRARMAAMRRQKQKRQRCKCHLYISVPVHQ
jgi:hypothetical protein